MCIVDKGMASVQRKIIFRNAKQREDRIVKINIAKDVLVTFFLSSFDCLRLTVIHLIYVHSNIRSTLLDLLIYESISFFPFLLHVSIDNHPFCINILLKWFCEYLLIIFLCIQCIPQVIVHCINFKQIFSQTFSYYKEYQREMISIKIKKNNKM